MKIQVLGDKICPSATLPAINPTSTGLELNQVLRDNRITKNGHLILKSILCVPGNITFSSSKKNQLVF